METIQLVYSSADHIKEDFFKHLKKIIANRTHDSIIWICFDTPAPVMAETISEKLQKEHYERIYYIDMISKTEGLSKKEEHSIFSEKPTDYNFLLTELDTLLKGKEIVVLDNINSLFVFDEQRRIMVFLKNLFNMIAEKGSVLLTYLIKESLGKEVENTILGIADVVVSPKEMERQKKPDLQNMTLRDVFSMRSPLIFFVYLVQTIVLVFLILVLIYIITKG